MPLVYGSTVLISGWGYTRESDRNSVADVLQYTTTTIITNVKCLDAYQEWFKESMFCAAVTGGGRDACQGKFKLIFCATKHNFFNVSFRRFWWTFINEWCSDWYYLLGCWLRSVKIPGRLYEHRIIPKLD